MVKIKVSVNTRGDVIIYSFDSVKNQQESVTIPKKQLLAVIDRLIDVEEKNT